MTDYEKEKIYPSAAKILKALGYDPDKGNVHNQFMERHKDSMNRKPSFKKHKPGRKKISK